MSASQVDPHDKMRSRDVNKVAKGEQAPRPAHEPGTVSRPPPPKQVDKELSKSKKGSAYSDEGKSGEYHKRSDDDEEEAIDLETAPGDTRFPFTNQTRHCYARYLEYHRCIQEKGEDAPECEKFARYYRSLCPSEWIEKWNEQREHGTFPGPL